MNKSNNSFSTEAWTITENDKKMFNVLRDVLTVHISQKVHVVRKVYISVVKRVYERIPRNKRGSD